MFQIKICGVTSIEDALAASAAGTDCLGLNFVSASPRCLSADRARDITRALPSHVRRVGLFVNASTDMICGIASDSRLDFIQLHGDEPPSMLAGLADWPVIKAFRVRGADLRPVTEYLAEVARLQLGVVAVLLDAYDATHHGGTGKRFDWQSVAKAIAAERTNWPPIVLAGGLRRENVAEAIHTVRPAAVDVASGVESSVGKKDAACLTAFVAAARQAFQAIGREPASAAHAIDRTRVE